MRMMSDAARNWFFGTHYMDYGTPAQALYARFVFPPSDAPAQFWRGMSLAALMAFVVFMPALDGEFVRWDDVSNLSANPRFRLREER